jgi:hypothetical protein
MIESPIDLESYVQHVYSSLMNLKDEGVVVSRNAIMIGKSGAKHEVDVFYQFERAGLTHKVAIECKFTTRPVEKADVLEFHSKAKDIGNIQPVFVSKSGYQGGAIDYAKHYEIQLLKLDDLPTLNILLAKRIESVALPSESDLGEPFWVLMELDNGSLSGSFYAVPQTINGNKQVVPLFFCKSDAETMHSHLKDKSEFVVRGVPQHMLKFTIGMGKGNVMFSLMYYPPENGQWPGELITPEDLEARFYHGKRI